MSLRTKEQLEELYAKSRERQAKKRKKRRRQTRYIFDFETTGMDGANAFAPDEMYKKLCELLITDNEKYEGDNPVK